MWFKIPLSLIFQKKKKKDNLIVILNLILSKSVELESLFKLKKIKIKKEGKK